MSRAADIPPAGAGRRGAPIITPGVPPDAAYGGVTPATLEYPDSYPAAAQTGGYPKPTPNQNAGPNQYPAPNQRYAGPNPPGAPDRRSLDNRPPIGPPPLVVGQTQSSAPIFEDKGLKNLFEPSTIVGRVGDHIILAADVEGDVNMAIAPRILETSLEDIEKHRAEIDSQRLPFFRKQLDRQIDYKLQYVDYLRAIPNDKREEALAQLNKQVTESFNKALPEMREKVEDASRSELRNLMQGEAVLTQLAMIMKQENIERRDQLDAYLRKYGSSLEKKKRAYGQKSLGRQAIFRNANTSPEVTYDEMLREYNEHLDDYQITAVARWEQLMARFDRFDSREEARRAIAKMGDEVYLGGAPLEAVARRGSQGSNADQGGQHDFITKGSLASQAIDEAIFTLPVGRLSAIIESEKGYHIVRVIERREEGHTPFRNAQVEIKKRLRGKKRQESVGKYLASLNESIFVWTIFDESEAGASPQQAQRQEAQRDPVRR